MDQTAVSARRPAVPRIGEVDQTAVSQSPEPPVVWEVGPALAPDTGVRFEPSAVEPVVPVGAVAVGALVVVPDRAAQALGAPRPATRAQAPAATAIAKSLWKRDFEVDIVPSS